MDEGRVLVLTGSGPLSDVADGLTERLPRAVHLCGAALQRLVLGDTMAPVRGGAPAPGSEQDLQWEGALLMASLYAGSGLDVVVTGEVAAGDLRAVLNRARELAPAVLSIVVGGAQGGPGLVLDPRGRPAGELVAEVLARLAEARLHEPV